MKPETKFQRIRGEMLRSVATVCALIVLGLWAAAAGIEKMWRKHKPKGG